MSLLKVNNPRSLLIKADVKDPNKKIVTIKSPKNEQKKIVIDVVKPPPQPKIIKVEQPNFVVKHEKTDDIDLQLPSNFMNCQFKHEKDDIKGTFEKFGF